MTFGKIIREPLLHFALLGTAIFVAASMLGTPDDAEPAKDTIVVTRDKIAGLAAAFTLTRRREPTGEEVAALIDGFVRQEALFREALALGLEQDDGAVRARLAQKMQFLGTAGDESLEPTDEQLDTFRLENPVPFSTPGRVWFEHVFLDAKVWGPAVDDRAATLLTALRERASEDEIDPASFSDPFRRPHRYERYAADAVGRSYGAAFGEMVATCPLDEWTGPVDSVYGVHLVRVWQREPGEVLPLEDVRERVLAAWLADARVGAVRAYEDEVLERYDVVIETERSPDMER